MSINNINFCFPDEITYGIFEYCLEEHKNIKLTCKNFYEIMNQVSETYQKYLFAVKLLQELNNQVVQNKGNSIISNTSILIKRISTEEIEDYKKALQCASKNKYPVIFNQFKESIIDALSELNKYDVLPNTHIPTNTPKELEADAIVHKAILRVRGYIRLVEGTGISITGRWQVNDRYGRMYGDYGMDGSPMPSVQVRIYSHGSSNWQMEPAPVGYIDSLFPAQLFFNKKNGDRVIFTHAGKEVVLICRQSSINQRFEDVFKKIISLHETCEPACFTPPISEEEQKEKLKQFQNQVNGSNSDV